MDDSKSDNTDELLTNIDPLIFESELLINEKNYEQNVHELFNCSNTSYQAVIVDDIMSARSNVKVSETGSLFKIPLQLSQVNIDAHNNMHNGSGLGTTRSASTNLYEASISAQTTPRNLPYSEIFRNSCMKEYLDERPSRYAERLKMDNNNIGLQNGEAKLPYSSLNSTDHIGFSETKTEIQRMQLTNKQLSTQLQEAKLSIQTLTSQLEQVQKECKHKESTLENLDNTLARLVAGWKKRDSQKDQEIENLNQQINSKDIVINESQRTVDESKNALANTMKSLEMERMKVEQLQKNLNLEIDSLKNERLHIISDNKELAKRIVHAETELRKLKDVCMQKSNSLELVKQQAASEKICLEKEINYLKDNIGKVKEENVNGHLEIQIRDEKIDQMSHEMKVMEEELHKIRQELTSKDIGYNETRAKLKAVTDDYNSSLRKVEKEIQIRLQHELNASTTALNEYHKKSLQLQASNFQTKLNEQSKRHRTEMDRLRQVAEQEIASRLADSHETISMLRARLERSEKSIEFWQHEKESVEKARNQISVRLYEIMKLGYRGSEEDSGKLQMDQVSHSSSIPKVINGPNKILNVVNNNALSSNYFEPIKLYETKSQAPTNETSFSRPISYSVVSADQTKTCQKVTSLPLSVSTTLSYQ